MPTPRPQSAFSLVTSLASRRSVHAAFAWLHSNPGKIMDWQRELVAIPAPPFGEQARSRWFEQHFRNSGLQTVETDAVGNVIAVLPAPALPAESTGPVVVISAHLDTVFPAGSPLKSTLDGDRLRAPGACDNGAGLAGLLAILHAILDAGIELPAPLILVGNVGEEGEGDLRGVRHFYAASPLASRVAAHIVLDGAGSEGAITEGIGSRRFRIQIDGPGGHSFTDAGTPNPIAALATALAALAETPLPREPRTTLNLGIVSGGTSVNSIPQSASAAVDFRSTSLAQLIRLEGAMRSAVEDAVELWNLRAGGLGSAADRRLLSFVIEKIGERPAARLEADSTLLEVLCAVDRHMAVRTDLRLGSTDANLPLSLGIPAISIGAGGDGGGAHTLGEWYSARDRDTGLKRVLLLTLAMLERAAER
jgi:tripeptide aminopeptidase